MSPTSVTYVLVPRHQACSMARFQPRTYYTGNQNYICTIPIPENPFFLISSFIKTKVRDIRRKREREISSKIVWLLLTYILNYFLQLRVIFGWSGRVRVEWIKELVYCRSLHLSAYIRIDSFSWGDVWKKNYPEHGTEIVLEYTESGFWNIIILLFEYSSWVNPRLISKFKKYFLSQFKFSQS